MKNPTGFMLAVVATASLLPASGGGGEGTKKKSLDPTPLERLSGVTTPRGEASVMAAAGEGFTIDLGDEYSLTIRNAVQAAWGFNSNDGAADVNDFDIRRARTRMTGHVWDKSMTYRVMLDWARGGGALTDGWFRWQFWESENNDSIAVRMGRQKGHHGREFSGDATEMAHIRRSLATRTLAVNRVEGIWFQGSHLEGGKLHWNVGVGNGDVANSMFLESGPGASNPDNEINYFFDVRFDPFGDFGDEQFGFVDLDGMEEAKGTIGAAVMVGNHRGTGALAGLDVESTSINIYTQWTYNRFAALAEGFLRSDDPDAAAASETDHTGWTVSGNYAMAPAEEGGSQWGFGGRVSMVTADDANAGGPPVVMNNIVLLGGASGDVLELEGTVSNYYHAHKLKTQLGYVFQSIDFDTAGATDLDNHILELQFQWLF
jgi:hypothetical protein